MNNYSINFTTSSKLSSKNKSANKITLFIKIKLWSDNYRNQEHTYEFKTDIKNLDIGFENKRQEFCSKYYEYERYFEIKIKPSSSLRPINSEDLCSLLSDNSVVIVDLATLSFQQAYEFDKYDYYPTLDKLSLFKLNFDFWVNKNSNFTKFTVDAYFDENDTFSSKLKIEIKPDLESLESKKKIRYFDMMSDDKALLFEQSLGKIIEEIICDDSNNSDNSDSDTEE